MHVKTQADAIRITREGPNLNYGEVVTFKDFIEAAPISRSSNGELAIN